MNSIDRGAAEPRFALPAYAELHCRSNFSFLTGASHPEELVERAIALGYTALAITDECSLAGVVRAHVAARDRPLHLIVGAEMQLRPPDEADAHDALCCSRRTAAATATSRSGSPWRGGGR
jgi:error-prone DNA polymerase